MQKYLLFFMMLSFCICAISVSAQEIGRTMFPLSADAGGTEYIREWLVLGPFFPGDLNTDFLLHVDGEANTNPKEGEIISTPDGRSLTWKRYESRKNTVDLLNAVGNHENAAAYAFCILKSDAEGKARFYAGSDDGIAVWINGRMAHRHTTARVLIPDRDMFAAPLKTGDNRCLVKISQGSEAWGFTLRADMSPANPAVLSGKVTDEAGQPASNVAVYLEQDWEEVARTRTDDSGNYRLEIFPVRGSYDLYVTKGESGDLRLGIPLREGQRLSMNLTLTGAVKIQGTALMLDDRTPHVAVVVQAVVTRRGDPSPQPVATALTDENGRYQLVNLKPGWYQLRCQVLGGYVYYRATGDALRVMRYAEETSVVEEDAGESLYIRGRKTLENIDFRFAPFKKGTWKSYKYFDGLADNDVHVVHQDADGNMWFGTQSGGVSRYDGKEFVNFTTKDGLAHNNVWAIHEDPDGTLWFGTAGGVSRYNGKAFINYTTEDGLAHNYVTAIHRDPDGTMWFGTGWLDIDGGGVSRYDGKEFVNFTTDNGLAHNRVFSIYHAYDDAIWFGTASGISRYDGRKFENIRTEGGMMENVVLAIQGDSNSAIWLGTLGGGVFRYDGRKFLNFTTKDGLPHNVVFDIYRDPNGILWFGTGAWGTEGGGVSRYDGKTFVNFTIQDGLTSNYLYSICGAADGTIWFGTDMGGVSRYDEKGLLNFTIQDGLVDNGINVVHRVPDGTLWFGTNNGVSRYDGREFVRLDAKGGLLDIPVRSICGDSHGNLWFGTQGNGILRYDGKSFRDFTEEDGLADKWIWSIYHSSDSAIWSGSWFSGAFRYDGEKFENFRKRDGLADNVIHDIQQDVDGNLWFGTRHGGVSRYDGNEFKNFTEEDGLTNNWVSTIYCAPDGDVWFGTYGGGVSHYDGKVFTSFTSEDGLAGNVVEAIYSFPDDVVWFGTKGGGISRYDGTTWTSLDTRDGLAGNSVWSIQQDEEGYFWFGTLDGGVTRYRRSTTPPKVRIVSVQTRKQVYTELESIPPINSGIDITIQCGAIDFKTVPEKRQYRYRLKGLDSDWRKPIKSAQFEWTPEEPDTYTFEVQAIDRDLNYSEPASVSIVISALPFYRTGAFLIVLIFIAGGSLCCVVILWIHRQQSARAERIRLQNELDDAHNMQTRLLPENTPAVAGIDIAGVCKPAREVSGDFFDYLSLVGERTGIAIADVTGKGLKGAMNAVLANGMLHEVAKNGISCGGILSALNADLYPRMEKQMFTSLGLAVLERDTRTLYWANAAQPYPIVRRGEKVFEIKSDGELPLGMAKNVTYHDWEMDLQTGDIVIFYTDGIIEAENRVGEMYGVRRLERFIMSMDPVRSAHEIIEHIMNDVENFVGAAEQYDDMTIVVVKKLAL